MTREEYLLARGWTRDLGGWVKDGSSHPLHEGDAEARQLLRDEWVRYVVERLSPASTAAVGAQQKVVDDLVTKVRTVMQSRVLHEDEARVVARVVAIEIVQICLKHVFFERMLETIDEIVDRQRKQRP